MLDPAVRGCEHWLGLCGGRVPRLRRQRINPTNLRGVNLTNLRGLAPNKPCRNPTNLRGFAPNKPHEPSRLRPWLRVPRSEQFLYLVQFQLPGWFVTVDESARRRRRSRRRRRRRRRVYAGATRRARPLAATNKTHEPSKLAPGSLHSADQRRGCGRVPWRRARASRRASLRSYISFIGIFKIFARAPVGVATGVATGVQVLL